MGHAWDAARDVCTSCGVTRKEFVETVPVRRETPTHTAEISDRKPRLGDGAPGGFGAPNYAGAKPE